MRAARGPTRPTVRLRRVPPLDPPFDDEADPQVWSVADGGRQLMLDLTPPRGRRRASPLRGARSVGPAGTGPAGSAGTGPGVRGPARAGGLPPQAVAAASPEARQAAHRFLTICLEVLNGLRPAAHVRGLADPPAADRIIARLAAGLNPVATARAPGRPRAVLRVRLLRVCEPRSGVVEAAAALEVAGRTRAMAFRLERRPRGWLGTAVELL